MASTAASMPPPASLSSIPLLSELSAPPICIAPTVPTTSIASAALSTFPDIESLLAIPLPSLLPSPARASPLIISPALPPIPGKVVEKARAGQFVEFKEFLPDNVLLLQRLQELGGANSIAPAAQPLVSGSRLREITDPLTWVSCFLAFMAACTPHKETRDLAAYGMVILQLAKKHGGNGWMLYDRMFRQHRAAGAELQWADINPSLLAATVLSHSAEGPNRSCSLCLSADHSKEDCALSSLEATRGSGGQSAITRPSTLPPRQPRRSMPYPASSGSSEICRRFNRGFCSHPACRYEHVCSGCQKPGHPLITCPDPKSREKGRAGPPLSNQAYHQRQSQQSKPPF